MCHPCVWIRTAILCLIPAGAILLLWQLLGVWLLVIPLVIFVAITVIRDQTKKAKKAQKRPQERKVYREANSPLLCLPCGRESVTSRATTVLEIQGHTIPTCDHHHEIAAERLAIMGVKRR